MAEDHRLDAIGYYMKFNWDKYRAAQDAIKDKPWRQKHQFDPVDDSRYQVVIQLRWKDEFVWRDIEVLDRRSFDDYQIDKLRMNQQFDVDRSNRNVPPAEFRYGKKGGRPLR